MFALIPKESKANRENLFQPSRELVEDLFKAVHDFNDEDERRIEGAMVRLKALDEKPELGEKKSELDEWATLHVGLAIDFQMLSLDYKASGTFMHNMTARTIDTAGSTPSEKGGYEVAYVEMWRSAPNDKDACSFKQRSSPTTDAMRAGAWKMWSRSNDGKIWKNGPIKNVEVGRDHSKKVDLQIP